jgi:hypothetical protein
MTFDQHPHDVANRIAKVVNDCDLLLASENLGTEDRIRVEATRLKWIQVAKQRRLETTVVFYLTHQVLGLRTN